MLEAPRNECVRVTFVDYVSARVPRANVQVALGEHPCMKSVMAAKAQDHEVQRVLDDVRQTRLATVRTARQLECPKAP